MKYPLFFVQEPSKVMWRWQIVEYRRKVPRDNKSGNIKEAAMELFPKVSGLLLFLQDKKQRGDGMNSYAETTEKFSINVHLDKQEVD